MLPKPNCQAQASQSAKRWMPSAASTPGWLPLSMQRRTSAHRSLHSRRLRSMKLSASELAAQPGKLVEVGREARRTVVRRLVDQLGQVQRQRLELQRDLRQRVQHRMPLDKGVQLPDARERGVRIAGEVVGAGVAEDALVVDGVAGGAIGQQDLPEHRKVVVGIGDFGGRCFFGVIAVVGVGGRRENCVRNRARNDCPCVVGACVVHGEGHGWRAV
jgi:hypothetical protein